MFLTLTIQHTTLFAQHKNANMDRTPALSEMCKDNKHSSFDPEQPLSENLDCQLLSNCYLELQTGIATPSYTHLPGYMLQRKMTP